MIERLLSYLKLYKAHRIARRFYKRYERLSRDVAFHPGIDVRLDVYSPEEGENHPVLIFVHGGGWSRFNKELFAPAAMKLLPERMVVVIPDHTLYPHAGYEQMTREVAAAISWTLENAGQHGGDPRRVVVAGHSSGGHLVSLAVMIPRFLEAHGHTRDELCGALYISSGYDLHAQYAYEQTKDSGGDTELMRTMAGITGGVENFSAASPINYVRPGLPPTLILHGDADQTIPVEIARAFHRALQETGSPSELKVYPGRGHSEILFAALTEERAQIVADIADFVHASTERGKPQMNNETMNKSFSRITQML